MLQNSHPFSGFAVKDLATTQAFYEDTLGLTVEDNHGMGWILKLADGINIFIYEKPDHQPAGFTILNFGVDDIDTSVDEMIAKGVKFEHYNDPHMPQDDKGIMRGLDVNMGPNIAWFKDPSGNILSVLQDS